MEQEDHEENQVMDEPDRDQRGSEKAFSPTRRLTLGELREKMGQISKLDPPEGWRLPGLSGEVKRGSFIELLGNDRQEWLVDLFLTYPETRLAWVAPKLEVFPTALAQRGVNLGRCLFLETEREISWSLMQVLRSGLFSFAICPSHVIPARKTDVFLRKLQILAERSYTTIFFLSEAATPSFGLNYRIEINALPERGSEARSDARSLACEAEGPDAEIRELQHVPLLLEHGHRTRLSAAQRSELRFPERRVRVLKQKSGSLFGESS